MDPSQVPLWQVHVQVPASPRSCRLFQALGNLSWLFKYCPTAQVHAVNGERILRTSPVFSRVNIQRTGAPFQVYCHEPVFWGQENNGSLNKYCILHSGGHSWFIYWYFIRKTVIIFFTQLNTNGVNAKNFIPLFNKISGFPGGPWLTLQFHCRRHKFDPCSGNFHMPIGVEKQKNPMNIVSVFIRS